eukprot:COSAG02_NODE_5766_length_4055_cov_2.385996_6_plen_57_part_01
MNVVPAGTHHTVVIAPVTTRGGAATHTLIKTPMHARPPMQMTARAFCKMRGLAAGLG